MPQDEYNWYMTRIKDLEKKVKEYPGWGHELMALWRELQDLNYTVTLKLSRNDNVRGCDRELVVA